MDNMMRFSNVGVEPEVDSGDKVSKRRVQNSLAAKRHREKRKRELGDLRDENDWLRTQQAQSRVLIEKMKAKLDSIGAAIPDFPASEALPLPMSMVTQQKHLVDDRGANEHGVVEHHQDHGMHDQQHHRQPSGSASASGAAPGFVSNEQLADSLAELEARLLDRSNASLHNVVSNFSAELSGLNRAVKAVREVIDGSGNEAVASASTPRGTGQATGEGEHVVSTSSSSIGTGRNASAAGLTDDVDASKVRSSRTKKHRL
jgi:hypothetical protein